MKKDQKLFDALGLIARHYSEVSLDFFRGMAARMSMSFEKYGAVTEAYPHKLNAVGCALIRLLRYLGPEEFEKQTREVLAAMSEIEKAKHRREHGNTEYLMDAANFIMIEFMLPRHANAHFVAEDSAASPGRIDNTGRAVGHESNTLSRENTRLGAARGRTSGGFYKTEGD